MRRGSGAFALAAVCFGVGVLVSCLFPSCIVLVITAVLLILIGFIIFRC